MRLIFLVLKFNFATGGGSSYELDTKIRALIGRGHTATVVTLFSKQNSFPPNLPYSVIEESANSLGLLDLQMTAYRALNKYTDQADAFYLEGQFGYGGGWYRLRGGRTPVMVHFNRELSSFPASTRQADAPRPFLLKPKLRFMLERLIGFPLMNLNNLFTFTSPILRDLYIKYGLARKKTLIVPDFFDSHELQKKINTSEVLKSRAEQKAVWTIICGGRMVKEKGFDIVIRALASVKNPEQFRLIITGSGPEEANLKQLALDLKIDSLVNFPGWLEREEAYRLFQQADIFVVPRWRPELTSMLVLEAMAFMVPYIVTKDTALAWQAGDSALKFADENYTELAEQIELLVHDPELRVRIVERGLRKLAELDSTALIAGLDVALLELIKK
ncbi:MAG: glycosyltransferase family 4 protein [bacterium]|nr:glycosyltransferase family 4 protein [bacterium]